MLPKVSSLCNMNRYFSSLLQEIFHHTLISAPNMWYQFLYLSVLVKTKLFKWWAFTFSPSGPDLCQSFYQLAFYWDWLSLSPGCMSQLSFRRCHVCSFQCSSWKGVNICLPVIQLITVFCFSVLSSMNWGWCL